MIINVHFDPATGEIAGWDNSSVAKAMPGLDIVTLETDGAKPRYTTHKINLASKQLVTKTADEQQTAILPALSEVNAAISRDLAYTDQFVAAPSDRPIKNGLQFNWLPYRATLRGLSGLSTTTAMVKAWPLRPDGTDAISHLRARLPAAAAL